MALTMKSISRTAQGRLTIHFINGNKSTLSVWCSRCEISQRKRELKDINTVVGTNCDYHKILWNGKILN